MTVLTRPQARGRYQDVDAVKSSGSTYTPKILADFVAARVLEVLDLSQSSSEELRILDPAIGDGELVLSVLAQLAPKTNQPLHVVAFDTNRGALSSAHHRVSTAYPDVRLTFLELDFVEWALTQSVGADLFTETAESRAFDLIIANPPYVRTQVMGAATAQALAKSFGLQGRVDLYQAFLIAMASVLAPTGAAGVIVSNRLMTTKGAGALRSMMRLLWRLNAVWDFGDTKPFGAAVLPAVLLSTGLGHPAPDLIRFSSIYEAKGALASASAPDAISAMHESGLVQVDDGRVFEVQHGTLSETSDREAVWRLASEASDDWLETVRRNTWATFGDVGRIRVGVKTCADKVFIRKGWSDQSEAERPELVRRLTTHHVARRFKAQPDGPWRGILYPHEIRNGVRAAVPIDQYPRSRSYLDLHRHILEGRTYVIEAGRQWYELWVPQDPAAWALPKLVFRDISEQPTFWIDLDGTVVNGDCYWLIIEKGRSPDLLWLAMAVANSRFAEAFYDRSFNNKLYGGKRRFITQYVERFPLPDPEGSVALKLVELAKAIYSDLDQQSVSGWEQELDDLVWSAFGLGEEVRRQRDL